MTFAKVLAVVTGDRSDDVVVERAADLVRPNKGHLLTLYVIRVDRGLPVDADVPPAVAKGEDVLRGVEERVNLRVIERGPVLGMTHIRYTEHLGRLDGYTGIGRGFLDVARPVFPHCGQTCVSLSMQ